MGPLTRMLTEGGVKRSIEVNKDDNENRDADRCGKRIRFSSGNIASPGIGNLMLNKKAIGRDNIALINALNDTTNTRSVGGRIQYLDINLANNANNTHKFLNISNSGYYSSGFPNLPTSKCFNINMGNTLNIVIVLPNSTSDSPLLFLPYSLLLAAHFAPDRTESITTSWAHPLDVQHQSKQTSLPYHFRDVYRYGFLRLSHLRGEVVLDHDIKHYIEIAGGHVGTGHTPTCICTTCLFKRLRIRFYGHGHDAEGKGKNNIHNYQLTYQSSQLAPRDKVIN